MLKGKHPIILGGDFNCVVDVALDKSGGNDTYGNLASQNLVNVCNDHKLIDIFRKLHQMINPGEIHGEIHFITYFVG